MTTLPPSALTAILRCPVTHASLTWLDPAQLEALNTSIAAGRLKHLDGSPVGHPVQAALTTPDGALVYRVQEGICVLLPPLAMTADPAVLARHRRTLETEKKILMDFYDQIGWQAQDGQFADAARFEDLRPVSQEYIHRCHLRVRRYLPAGGIFLLDAASGPVQYPEYLTYSEGYTYRVCADISFVALREARRKLGEKGLYLLCDVTDLPLRDGSMDGAVSLHTVYHVPAAQQADAVRELYRVLRPGGSAAVVYSWGDHALLTRLFLLPLRLARRLLRRGEGTPPPVGLYYFHHDYAWFRREIRSACHARLAVWRSVGVPFLKRLIHERLAGRFWLRLLYRFEEWFPRFFGRIGQYPLFHLRKPQ